VSLRIVFVAGLHRSGTSLVHRCLAAHPDVSGFADTGVPEDEGQHLQTVAFVEMRRLGVLQPGARPREVGAFEDFAGGVVDAHPLDATA